MFGRTVTAFGLLVALAIGLRAFDQATNETQRHKDVFGEILALRAELAEYFVEVVESTVMALDRVLANIRQDIIRLEGEERLRQEQLTQVDQQLSNPDLELDSRRQLETVKADLSGPTSERLRSEQSGLQKRQGDLAKTIERQQDRLQALREKSRQLNALLKQH